MPLWTIKADIVDRTNLFLVAADGYRDTGPAEEGGRRVFESAAGREVCSVRLAGLIEMRETETADAPKHYSDTLPCEL